jgi:hypothetical protein
LIPRAPLRRTYSPNVVEGKFCEVRLQDCVLTELTLTVPNQGSRGPLCEPDIAPLTGLGSLEDVSTFRLGERAAYLWRPGFEVQIIPPKSLQLAPPQTGGNGHDVQGLQAVAGDGIQQGPHLFAGERLYLFSTGLRRLYRALATLQGIRPSSAACLSALWSVLWIWSTVRGASPLSSFSR